MYDVKVVNCGNIVEIYKYKQPIKTGYKVKEQKRFREKTESVIKENLNRSIKRSKRKIFELVNTNYIKGKSSFLTVTFKENLTDYDLAMYYWKLFKQKVEYAFEIKLQYCGVVEFQERGAIHFHICLFNVGYLEQNKLYDLWNSIVPGGINIQGIKDNECDNVGAYMTYYMNKDLGNGFGKEEYKGKKRYFYSRNLLKPSVNYLFTEKADELACYSNLLESLKDNITFEYKSEFKKTENREMTYTDMETGEIKKELVERTIIEQELQYKQITLSKNNKFRNNKKII